MKLSLRHYGIILTSITTAFLHISLLPDVMFTLNGLGFLGLLGAYFLPMPIFQQRHKLIWQMMVGYTLLTIILWLAIGNHAFVAGTTSATGYYAKAAEILLLAFLWADKPRA